ncbi:7-cyano-7-deazaguanine synthase [Shouchella shacheensis]|uniref:7-cyano-7-deazaguanine synthase n=1 Tax=Shouchella shacheensis TaxID=1649580 RepID=UPI0007403661|nr:7-cyano-7-deazaguanine synthase [Shouchella shacheensis]
MTTHNLLWTGGWDSTFRVLDLTINKKRIVQPYYVLDNTRISTKMERKTIKRLIVLVSVLDKNAAKRILPVKEVNVLDIISNDSITNNYKRMAAHSHLGSQYDWLARFADSEGVKGLELSIHLDDKAQKFLKADVVKKVDGDDEFYILDPTTNKVELTVFKYYKFPLLDYTKLDMEEKAKESGFNHIMEETWFCHSPVHNNPCGICNPCKYTKEEGLGRRVPEPNLYKVLNRKVKKKTNAFIRKIKNKIP